MIRTGNRSYMPSPKAVSPLPLMHPLKQLRREAQPVLQALANEIGETVVLVLYMDIERMVVEIAQTQGSLTPYYDTWLHGPLHCSGAGKALLLKLEPERRHAVLGPDPFRALTPRTLTSRQALEENLERAGQRGYATSRDEHHMGLTAISANIHDWHHAALGCLVMTGHSRAFDEARIESVGETLRRSAELLLFQAPSLRSAAESLGH
ncbi:IclR family transcriptional regulator [Fodinicurvata halophila]|uniref:IclR family transcriptional regulator n=1 Tax=Fodinicurvata halophila TaxID=1419723 RepID=UPI003636F311